MKITSLFCLVLFCVCLGILPVFTQTFQGKVVNVADGDTITVLHSAISAGIPSAPASVFTQ